MNDNWWVTGLLIQSRQEEIRREAAMAWKLWEFRQKALPVKANLGSLRRILERGGRALDIQAFAAKRALTGMNQEACC